MPWGTSGADIAFYFNNAYSFDIKFYDGTLRPTAAMSFDASQIALAGKVSDFHVIVKLK